ncbi:DUF4352 domain-containing protein [Thomasclavelia cocleata]|jgi:hypothetical protein|uniref:DUF4352 domain-containing protein n=1 Tax=Thomasclavelia cocleata TaxID=69824 RepID=A0A1I0FGT5_9FIRM|nr:DUF4352 domain-containing protein [Thomasclavelia cocleata]MCI9630405.1 DUF4352 domain-containing protein [Thomasclavelia cocleata]MCR1961403.1 DUF4352 domain-containing protein [Thomasclavelia cocleata]NDO41254.1 DUF4352 domain-containing protein [Thomasclavelia cocleata]SET57426.1 protein of unknown function [Thomasclavelia cocleata]GFI40167.1 hypothetical protein IMSAGC017_00198 [Thomasclavelia cocleata]
MKILRKFKELSLMKKILCFIVIIGLIGIVAGGSSNGETKKKEDEPTNEVTNEKEEYKIGEVAKVGEVDYLINNVEVTKQIGSEYVNTKAKDTFLIIDISITNNEKESLTVADNFFKLLNGENEYSADSTGAIYLNDNSIIFKELNPGVTLQGKIVFDVPESVAMANETKLQVQTGIWGSEKDVISLSR